ncbi:4'-phosphopantetheinyl transferase superfamily protein [Mycoplasmopsis felis]|uniref:4'-phosphopantetheinyl transferase domain-containing protein n=1 Tax=Mycoplasmopsis felis TaxID=33923 RepID=A0A809SE46_9BACT|nr:4'-phosphopantetheinyl transferase superfamily protein [Mycoplasmopsis felis]MCU9938211.1 4'-phosphopantetheinyl transferase superfamily protein [Mycoplasmopsis felis]MCU9940215.1 4'-phosphopantetheinyl transferase superfamily protein [Mycoplasmopsis felis]UWV79461.1 4'-phosphopantetheinyl transferase superfamily protein [Mycoplasmopsis felis]UWV85539.1 4'-phosphopantetheinyl transferase superfamily protein [Mycoplasmopsis felis]WAM00687.1 4'-phosphopantetheinyl transferase superfamily prot
MYKFKIGVDLTRISRFENKNIFFINRILSKEEIKEFEKLNNEKEKSIFLARSWAIKEAIFKSDNKYFEFNKINLYKRNKRWHFKNFKISISYEDDYIVAFVVG